MTREEARYLLNNLRSVAEGKEDEAIDMAIEALQAEYEDYEHATLVDIKEPLKVSVVRCKDCRHGEERKTANYLPFTYCTRQKCSVKADDYCSYGERAEQTDNYQQDAQNDEVIDKNDTKLSTSHGRLIDADAMITIQVFDEMYEEYDMKTMTVKEALDLWADEGCPPTVEVGRPQEELLTHEQAWEEIGRPHGEWINPHEDGHGYWVGTCSNCNKYSMEANNFCPFCGADMRAEQTEYLDKTFPNHDGEWYEVTDMLTEYKFPFHDEMVKMMHKLTLKGDKND